MTDTTSTTTVSTDAVETDEKRTFEKGTWQATLDRAGTLFNKSANDRKRATVLLWEGAQNAIEAWLPETGDASAENLYNEVMDILGKPRKGDASKIKTVALAVKNNGLTLALHANLSQAYAEAVRLTKTVKVEAEEDDAAEEAVRNISAPNTASTPESAAKIVLSQGVDEAARLLLDALGASNEAAHRSLLRAISNEIAGRVKPVEKTVKDAPKAGATQASKSKATKATAAKAGDGATKAKPAKKAAAPAAGAKAKPVGVKRAKPAQATATETSTEAPVETPEVPVKKAAVRRPVRR